MRVPNTWQAVLSQRSYQYYTGTNAAGQPQWSDVSLKLLSGKTIFRITPPEYVTGEIVAWVRQKIG